MVSYICIVLYNLFYTVLTCMISLNLMMVHFYPMSWIRRVCTGLTQGHRAGPGSTEGELLGRLGAILGTVFCVSLGTLLLSPGRQGPVTEPHSWISVLPLVQVPLQKEIHFLIFVPY